MTMKRTIGSLLLLSLLAATPATQPAPSALEVRANTAFTNGQYALALPMLQKLQMQFEGQPDKLGPLEEKVKVCQTQLAQAAVVNGTVGATATPQSLSAERKPHA